MKRVSFLTFCLACVAILLASGRLHAQQVTMDGVLDIVWGDPHPQLGSNGEVRHTLTLTDGTRVPVQLRGQESVLARSFGRRVTVAGNRVNGAVVADSVTSSQAPQSSAAVLGSKKVIYLLLKFSDDPSVPHPPAFYTNLNNPDTVPAGETFPSTINGFFNKTSWNQFYWIGSVGGMGGLGAPDGWLTLPQSKSYYAPCGWSSACANLTAIANDGMALGRAQGIDFKIFDNINFVLSNDLDCCAWGGSYFSSIDAKSYGVTWEPPWGQEPGVYVHEMGHSIGLPHSGWTYYAYDSPWDTMSGGASATTMPCGSYNSKNSNAMQTIHCSEPGGGFNAGYKDHLGWIPSSNVVTANTNSNVTITLDASSLPLGSSAKMIKICITGVPCSGSTARYFTVEARVKALGPTSQFDNGIPGEGVIIHEFRADRAPIGGACFFNNQSGWAVPVDSTPGDYDSTNCNSGGRSYPNYALFNAQWKPGETYTNSSNGLTIKVLSRSGSTFVVAINPPNPNLPTCKFQMTKPVYVSGDVLTIQSLAVSNPLASALPVEYKFWLDLPGGGTYSYLRGGADDSVSLAAGASIPDALGGPKVLAEVTPSFPPRGSYSINCRLENPVTGQDFVVEGTPFTVQ